MTRYLTPSKIGLVVLVSLYCEGHVPNAALIPTLSFVLSHLISPSTSEHTNSTTKPTARKGVITVEDFEAATRPHQSIQPGRSLFDLFIKALWSIDSLNALHEFFAGLEEYLVSPEASQHDEPSSRILLSRTSPLGIFFRRASLEFTRLQFNDSARLWTGFAKFRAPTESVWRKRNPVAIGPSFDLSISEFDVRQPNRLALAAYGAIDANNLEESGPSSDDIERLLEFDLDKLQSFGSRVPKSVQDSIKGMIAANPNTPNMAYLASFFDAWRAGDFTGATENLHRYFDYTVRNRDKTLYQYALLHMAILQADFGCFDEAVAAMNETIATARENQDANCLNFSLSWLGHLNKVYPNDLKKAGYAGMLGPEKDRLAFLGEKAREMKNWSIVSSTLLSEANLAMSLGGEPAYVSERLCQSAHLNFLYHGFTNCGVQLLAESALYARTGLNVLANNDCEILLDCYADKSPAEDVVRARCRLAKAASQFGQYTQANAVLETFDEEILRTLRHNHYVISHSGLIKLKHTLRKYDLVAAEHMLHQLQSGAWKDPDLNFQISLLEIEYLMQRKSLSTAFDRIEDCLEAAQKQQTDVMHQIILLLLKAELFSKAGKAGQGFTIVLRAASMAFRFKLLPLLWEAMGALANILTFFGEFDHAARLMSAVLPQVSVVCWNQSSRANMSRRSVPETQPTQRYCIVARLMRIWDWPAKPKRDHGSEAICCRRQKALSTRPWCCTRSCRIFAGSAICWRRRQSSHECVEISSSPRIGRRNISRCMTDNLGERQMRSSRHRRVGQPLGTRRTCNQLLSSH